MSVESSTVKGVFMDGSNASYDRNAKKFLSEQALLGKDSEASGCRVPGVFSQRH